jgi:hypothetical protein
MSRIAWFTVVVLVAIGGAGYRVATSSGRLQDTNVSFASAPRAPRSARSAFVSRAVSLPPGALRRLKLAQTRRIAVVAFPGQSVRLFVAPGAGIGFCYAWAIEPGPGVWADEFFGCAVRSKPLIAAYDDTRISIMANRAQADRVLVKLSDGRLVQPNVRWVSAPINAGFALYQPPTGVSVVEVDAMSGKSVVQKEPIGALKP